MQLTPEERDVILKLVVLAGATSRAMDNTEVRDECAIMEILDFNETGDALDDLEALPDDKSGCYLGPADKAKWALRRLIGD